MYPQSFGLKYEVQIGNNKIEPIATKMLTEKYKLELMRKFLFKTISLYYFATKAFVA